MKNKLLTGLLLIPSIGLAVPAGDIDTHIYDEYAKAKVVTYTTVRFDSYEEYFKWHVEKVKRGNFNEDK